jgi:hypothetical protein
MLIDQLDRWRAAVRDGRPDDARMAVEDIRIAGRMLAIDPEFRRLFARQHSSDADAEAAVESLSVFLQTVAQTLVPGAFRASRSRA